VSAPPDFEIDLRLRADRLSAHAPPDADVDSEGAGVSLAREQTRRGLPPEIEPGRRYEGIEISKRIRGVIADRA
jgi:hypothetical protein